ncbi:actin-histidine N-methyltransferase [Drosophila takahashii]|uniref:actin-histidine N-methyltransferase n=1 Tax=Drosophila takahashii TaxID=29030 RepID=UPI001CF7FDA6|nr:actin-histidine N-methyltransferase [Drosophila takahashii]
MGKNNNKRNKKAKQPNGSASGCTASSGEDVDVDQQAARSLPTLNPKKRNQVNKLVEELLELVEKQPANPNEEWRQYEQLQQLLKQLMILEEPLSQAVCPPISDSASDSPEDQSRLAKVEAFAEWAAQGGVHSEGLEIAIFPGYQLGLRATRPLAAEELVLSVPRQLIFSEESDSDCRLFGNMPQATHLNLAYDLLIEKIRGPFSQWRPYIDVLPAKYNTVLYFSAKQMERLRGTAACSLALRQCRVIAKQFGFLYRYAHILTERSRGLRSLPGDRGLFFTQHGLCYKLYRWAVSTVMTRQNLVPSEKQETADNPKFISALIPYWDMANHRPGKITSFYGAVSRQLECTAQEACAAGEQFFIYYGDRSNTDLLVHNGFVDVNNLKDYVNIRVGLSPTDALAAKRASILDKLNIRHTAELRVLPAPEFISKELLAFVRVFKMSAEQLDHWCSDLERAGDLLHIDCALETDHETRTWQFLEDRLKLLLAVFDKELREADEAKELAELEIKEGGGGSKPGQEIELMLLLYRRLERSILAGALQYAQEHRKV